MFFKKWFFCTPRWYSYGGMFESIFLAVNVARYYKKNLIFFYPENHFDKRYHYSGFLNQVLKQVAVDGKVLSNRNLFQRTISKWLEFNRWIHRSDYFVTRMLSRFFRACFPISFGFTGLGPAKKIKNYFGITGEIEWGKVLQRPNFIDLTEQQNRLGRLLFQKMEIPDGRPFVCLYVRDIGFESQRDTPSINIVNSEIENFSSAISFIEDQGLYVIRVGDPTMIPFHTGTDRFIDYVHSEFYNELLDLFLLRHCTFWLGTLGGGRVVPLAYGRPSVVVNGIHPEVLGFCVNPHDVFISKHVYSKNDRRFLSLREQYEKIDVLNESMNTESCEEYIRVDNTPQEIEKTVEEFYRSEMVGNFRWDLKKQETFYKTRQRYLRQHLYNQEKNEWKTRNLEWFGHVRPHIGQAFLQNCWDETDYLGTLSDYYTQHQTLNGVSCRLED